MHAEVVAPDAAETAIEVEALHKIYPTRRGSVEAVRDASFTVRRGEFVSLIGPSGCGKSTVLKIVAGLTSYESGRVEVGGAPASVGRSDVGMMPQSPALFPWRTVLENVLLPAEIYKLEPKQSLEKAMELLQLVGLEGFEDKYPRELSGGMQQRASLARLLVSEPSTLLMDEPFSALDEFTREHLTKELARLHTELKRTVLYVTHNIAESAYLSDRVVVMRSKPGGVLGVVEVDIPRPREFQDLDDPHFLSIMSQIRRMFSPGEVVDG